MSDSFKNKINREELSRRIDITADRLLETISCNTVKMFVDASEVLIENAFDGFVLFIDESISRKGTDSNLDIMLKFSDIRTGYRQQMRDWAKHYPISIDISEGSVEKAVSLPLFERKSFQWPVLIVVSYFVLIMVLFFLTGLKWPWWLAIVVLSFTVVAGLIGNRIDKNRESKMKRQSIVNSTIIQMNSWLDAAENHHGKILHSLGISI